MKSPEETDATGHGALLADSAALIGKLLDTLKTELDQDGLVRDAEGNSNVNEICRTVTAATTVTAELRARDKARAKERDSLTAPLVMEWLRSQAPEMRLHILRELSATMDGEGSVLT